jgi:membrane protease YdiL (CAAX protease family)
LSSIYNPEPNSSQALAPAAPNALPSAQSPPHAEDPVWSVPDVAMMAVLVIIGSFIFTLFTIGAVKLTPALRDYQVTQLLKMPVVILIPETLAYLSTFAFMIVLVRQRSDKSFWKEIKWNWPRREVTYAMTGLVLALSIEASSRYLPIPKSLPIEQYFRDRNSAWLMMIFGITLAPFFEELFFRGFLYPALVRLRPAGWFALSNLIWLWPAKIVLVLFFQAIGIMKPRFGTHDLLISIAISALVVAMVALLAFKSRLLVIGSPVISLLTTAALFATIHEGQLARAWAPLLMIFVVGLVLTFVRAQSQSVAASFLVHASYNATLFTTLLIATDGFRHLERMG